MSSRGAPRSIERRATGAMPVPIRDDAWIVAAGHADIEPLGACRRAASAGPW